MLRTKSFIALSVGAALLTFGQVASACAISAWSSATGLSAADTGEPIAGFSRYSGRCSLRANGPTKFVQDNSPANATSYFARYYVNTGTLAGADIFKARDAANADVIRVSYNAGALSFFVKGAAVQPANIPAVAGRWYSVELSWAQGAAAAFNVKVQGNGGLAVTAPATTINSATDVINNVQLGMVNAGATGQGFFDEFDSRRTTAPGRLCKGDANGGGTITAGDAQAVIAEFTSFSATPVIGQPDCNESGTVTPGDAQCIINLFTTFTTCGA